MNKVRWEIVLVAIALFDSPYAAAEPITPSYTVVIDVSADPFGPQRWKFLDQYKIVELCGDQDGCTFEVKIDGPGGKANQAETIHLLQDSLEYTSTTTLGPPPPPRVDADGENRFLAYARREAGGDLAACDITDQDDTRGHRDSTVGFSMSFVLTGPGVGATACALQVRDAPAPPTTSAMPPISEDPWLKEAPDFSASGWVRASQDDIWPVSPDEILSTTQSLQTQEWLAISPTEAERLTGAGPQSGKVPYLLRGLCMGCSKGDFALFQKGTEFAVHYGGAVILDKRLRRWPVVGWLDRDPTRLFVSYSVAR